RRRVDERQDPIDVVDDRLVEEPFVSLLETRQQHVAIDVPLEAVQVLDDAAHHLFPGRDAVRQQPAKAQAVAVPSPEGDGLIERLVAEDVEPSLHDCVRSYAASSRNSTTPVSIE